LDSGFKSKQGFCFLVHNNALLLFKNMVLVVDKLNNVRVDSRWVARMQMALGYNIYGYGHIFPLILSLAALIFLFSNRTDLKSYRFYIYCLVCLSAFFLTSILYVLSMFNMPLLHSLAGLLEFVSITAIVLVVRNDRLKDDSNA